jgi:hypothetical protein
MGAYYRHRIYQHMLRPFTRQTWTHFYSMVYLLFSHTMTSKIPLCDVVESINDFLIQNPTSLPVIISLENHCSLPYQEVMAKLFIQIFSDRLYIPTDQSLQGNLPSPNR